MDLTAALLLMAAKPMPEPCTSATATGVSIERVARAPSRWLGRCVRVRGFLQYTSLYSSVEGLYLAQRRDPDSYSLGGDLRHRIGLYGEYPSSDALKYLSVVGVVDSCERRGREARRLEDETNRRTRAAGVEDEIIVMMLSGYCHYFPGAVIKVNEAIDLPARRLERLVGDRARLRYGNLVPGRRTWHRYADLHRRAEAFLAAIRTGDRARLSVLHGRFGARRQELDRLLDDPDSPFRELRGGGARPYIILYYAFDNSGRPPEEQRHQDGFICYCRALDCEGRWPISTVDTGPRPDHPYACVLVQEDGAGQVFMRADHRVAPLHEPAGTALGSSD